MRTRTLESAEADTIQSPKRSSGSRSAATGAHKPDHSKCEDMEDSSKSCEDTEDSYKSSKRKRGVMGRSDMPIKIIKYLQSREKFVYIPQENACPTLEDDIALTWVQSSSKNTVISDVLDMLLMRYKKKKTVQEALKGLSAKDLLYQELKRNGCHIMFSAPKPGLGARKVIAAAITERVMRYPADEFSPHYGLSIRFHCGNIKPLQCLFHRILSTVYWDNRLFKHDKHRTTHIYLRLVKDTSPSLFKVNPGSVEDEKKLWNKFGFLDAVDKSAPEEYFWKEDRDIYAPNPLSHFESSVVQNIQAIYQSCGGDGTLQSPSVAESSPTPNSSFFFIDPGPKNQFRSVFTTKDEPVRLFAHNTYLGWSEVQINDVTEMKGTTVIVDLKKCMAKALRTESSIRYVPKRAGATDLIGNSRCCAWISVIKMLWNEDKETAIAMRRMMEVDKTPFEDMRLMNVSKGSKEITLSQYMKQWKYQLQKVRCEQGKKLHDTFLKDGKIGFFLCLLIDDHDQSTHTVGVHKAEGEKGTIWDPELKDPLPMNGSLNAFSQCLGGKHCKGMVTIVKVVPPKGAKNNK